MGENGQGRRRRGGAACPTITSCQEESDIVSANASSLVLPLHSVEEIGETKNYKTRHKTESHSFNEDIILQNK